MFFKFKVFISLCLLVVANSGLVGSLHTLELSLDEEREEGDDNWSSRSSGACPPAASPGVCNYTCSMESLKVTPLDTATYAEACQTGVLSWNILGEPGAVIRLHVLGGSQLQQGDSLAVLEDVNLLEEVTKSEEKWVSSDFENMTINFSWKSAKSHVKMELVAYNQSKVTDHRSELAGMLSAPERTGQPDYALNTEMLWILDTYAYKINFTVQQFDLDAFTGDLLVIGYGKGPWESQPPGVLLSGSFETRQVHVNGGRAFVYFLSRNHGPPRSPFQITYTAEGINGTTTVPPTTTDRNHPPTPSDVDFDLAIYLTDVDPRLFLDKSTNMTEKLQHQLAFYSDVYRHDHNIDVWRPVHTDDIQFSTWAYCNATSGWTVPPKSGCIRVRWYVEMLTRDGDWAFVSPDLRTIIQENHLEMSRKLGYTVSLNLQEVNTAWFWGITIIIAPLALLVFLAMFVLFTRTASYRDNDEIDPSGDLDERCVADDIMAGKEVGQIFKEVPADVVEEKNKQLRNIFNEDEYEDYDAELRSRHRRQALQARYSAQHPLKSALKTSKPAPVAVPNPAFEPDVLPDGDQVPFTSITKPPKETDLLDDLQSLAKKEAELPGLELPRVTELVKSDEPQAPVLLYSMKNDGTGTMVDDARPGDNIIRVDTLKNGKSTQEDPMSARRASVATAGKRSEEMNTFTTVTDIDRRKNSLGTLVDNGIRKDSTLLLERLMSNGSGEEEC